jgi:hypothetical protein
MAPKGKWAAGITPRSFCWVIKDRLAVCERPGGCGTNHRRVRRQEEIIWLREQGFTCVISLLQSPHNLHNYDELGVRWLHRPFNPVEGAREALAQLYPEVQQMLAEGGKLVLHRNELSDAVCGLVAGYLIWTSLVPTGPRVISLVEQMTRRQLGPVGRELVGIGLVLRDAMPPVLVARAAPAPDGPVVEGVVAASAVGPAGATPAPAS